MQLKKYLLLLFAIVVFMSCDQNDARTGKTIKAKRDEKIVTDTLPAVSITSLYPAYVISENIMAIVIELNDNSEGNESSYFDSAFQKFEIYG